MITDEEMDARFTYHKPFGNQPKRLEKISKIMGKAEHNCRTNGCRWGKLYHRMIIDG